MKIKCDFCGAFINDYDEKCSNCGGLNSHLVRSSNEVPKTISELQQWYKDRNLPDESITRFFIGKNYEGSRAFGIYKDEKTGTFIVYKNKSDGSRAIRYKGNDEEYAVNELYLKLKEEILNQKQHNLNISSQINNSNNTNSNDTNYSTNFNEEKYRQDLNKYRNHNHIQYHIQSSSNSSFTVRQNYYYYFSYIYNIIFYYCSCITQ